MMKYTLFIMLLAIATPIFPQEVENDTLQELPKTGIKADRRAQLERGLFLSYGSLTEKTKEVLLNLWITYLCT